MKKYILGLLKNLFNPAVSLLTQIDNKSEVNRKARIYSFVKIFNSKIDKYSYVGRNTRVVHAEIGKYCSIAGGSIIGMGTHALKNISTSSLFTSKKNGTGSSWTNKTTIEEYQPIEIGNDVWIGTRVIIMSGVKIGNGAVLGAVQLLQKIFQIMPLQLVYLQKL
jgi:acetyltransferase-like isoleucine patch superfamily enzyme